MRKTILVTGATDGIGKQTALELARLGHSVWIHGRNPAKASAVVDEMRRMAGNARVQAVTGDFGSLKQVKALAKDVDQRVERLDVLINNAGVWMNERVLTEDGIETTFQVNHLAPFLLTNLLLPLLRRSAPARVVTVASQLHKRGQLHLDDLQLVHSYSGYTAYTQSKICNVLFAHTLAERLRGSGVTSNVLHPGIITTKLLWTGFQSTANDIAEGAKTSMHLAIAPELEGVTGKYFEPVREMPSADITYDAKTQAALWQISEDMLKPWR
jgi:NAD(P)-dependent dehydrogenase (short-subunit alcohol dehydrogenase family)